MKEDMMWVKKRELLVYIAIFLYSTALFMKRVDLPIEQNILNKLMTFGTMLALINFVFDRKMNLKQWLLTGIIGLILLVDSLPTGSHEILYLFIILWSCRNINKDVVIKFLFYIVLSMTLIVAFLTVAGVVHNTVYVLDGTRVRSGLGYNVWSILPFQYMAICFYYLYFKRKKANVVDLVIISLGALPIYMLTDTKSALAYTVFGAFMMIIIDHIHFKNWNHFKWLIWVPEIFSIVSFLLVLLFIKGNAIAQKINVLTNYRIHYPALALQELGIHWLANPEFVTKYSQGDVYFAIDNNYLNLLFTWGILSLVVVCFIYTCIVKICIKNKNMRLLFIVLFSMFVGLTWSRMLVLIESMFLVCFADIFKSKTISSKTETQNKKKRNLYEKNTYSC